MNKPLVFFVCTLAADLLFADLARAQAVAPAVAPAAAPDRAARRVEFQARAQARFAESDRNHDGRLSLAEFQSAADRKLAMTARSPRTSCARRMRSGARG